MFTRALTRLPATGHLVQGGMQMDISSVLSMASALQSQSVSQAKLEANLNTLKDYQELQSNAVAQLLASMPSVNPDGVGGVVDVIV